MIRYNNSTGGASPSWVSRTYTQGFLGSNPNCSFDFMYYFIFNKVFPQSPFPQRLSYLFSNAAAGLEPSEVSHDISPEVTLGYIEPLSCSKRVLFFNRHPSITELRNFSYLSTIFMFYIYLHCEYIKGIQFNQISR